MNSDEKQRVEKAAKVLHRALEVFPVVWNYMSDMNGCRAAVDLKKDIREALELVDPSYKADEE